MNGLYETYIHSTQWRKRRYAKLEEAEYRCQYCGESDELSVHHLCYDHLGYEETNELVVLCPSCHWVADELRRNPYSDLWKRLTEKKYKVKKLEQKPQPQARKSRKQIKKESRKRRRANKLKEREENKLVKKYILS
jgi:hypothetical protein